MKRLGELKPREVHIQNSDLKPNGARNSKKLRAIPKTRAAEIAAAVTEKTGIPAGVYSGTGLFG